MQAGYSCVFSFTTICPRVLCCLQGAVNFKFGVLYAKAGQKTDNEMFSNGEQLLTEKSITPQIEQLGLKMPSQLCQPVMLH